MTPSPDEEILEEFSPLSIKCRPEAPWIKRCGNSIKFTEEIQNDSKVKLVCEGIIFLSYRGGEFHIHANGGL